MYIFEHIRYIIIHLFSFVILYLPLVQATTLRGTLSLKDIKWSLSYYGRVHVRFSFSLLDVKRENESKYGVTHLSKRPLELHEIYTKETKIDSLSKLPISVADNLDS